MRESLSELTAVITTNQKGAGWGGRGAEGSGRLHKTHPNVLRQVVSSSVHSTGAHYSSHSHAALNKRDLEENTTKWKALLPDLTCSDVYVCCPVHNKNTPILHGDQIKIRYRYKS